MNSDDIVFYRKVWIWGMLFILATPVAVLIGLTGELYSIRNGQVKVVPKKIRLTASFSFGMLFIVKIIVSQFNS